jgi:geranylgeranyl diphosphate synthase type II
VNLNQLHPFISSEYQAFVQKTYGGRELLRPILYSAENPGKLLRPLIMATVALELWGKSAAKFPWQKLFPLMWAVELHHTYTLIHDDLPCMDNDDVRRGRPTVHKAFSESSAVLAGDALLGDSFQLLSKTSTMELAQLVRFFAFCTGAKGLIAGQLMDLSVIQGNRKDLSVQEILRIHELKTGRLFLFSFLAPLYLNIFESSSLENIKFQWKLLTRLASHVGLLFQLNDDEDDAKGSADAGPNLFAFYPKEAKDLQQKLRAKITSSMTENGLFADWELLHALFIQYQLI